MKLSKNIYLGLGMLASFALASCQADMDTPTLTEPVPTVEANTTIADLKAAMWKEDTNYATAVGYKDEASKTPYVIKGRVISSDASGNIYKSMYIQDATGAITLSINQASLYNFYPFGQEIVLNLSPKDFVYPDYDKGEDVNASLNFYIGKYAGLEQIGGLGVYNGTQQVSFMSYELFKQGVQLSGNPDTQVNYVRFGEPYPADGKMYCIQASIAEINNCNTSDDIRKMQSQRVEFRNVHFQDGGKEPFAPYQENASRNLMDASGNTIIVRNSGYASFYNQTLPEGSGTVRGLLSYFNGKWQLILRSAADCIFDSKGTKDDPYSTEEAQGLVNTGASGWVKGYIVGSLKAGVQTVASDSDIEWGANDGTDNNLVIAPSADVKDWKKCVILPLAQGSPARSKGNLLDNPGNLGKKILAYGTFAATSGMTGLAGNDGSANEVEIQGVTLGGGDTPEPPAGNGDGSKEKPYDVAYVLGQTANQTGVWVEGWVVGYVKSGSPQEWRFTNDVTGVEDSPTAGYNGSNIILGPLQTSADKAGCIAIQVPAGDLRNALGLRQNPGMYLKHVKIKGNIEKYFGVMGLKSITEYEEIN